ncbi:beta-fructofuranosidase [Metabacillus crassostreae]|uniref:glycoside hydrolase family 32 protein n=1 Tax=Metabacillus crassostreae TaxID=929098 RepID=UPI00195BB5A4|nr:glycoside hydrolase family 32 protein [Metabacillus crassostreae]MBM7604334.1 beta-fructofuranosidase [Metabacillus crassostreae]
MVEENRLRAAERELNKLKQRVHDHEWRLQYHVAPIANWMNDPNGFCFFKGEYHLFYQHHPYKPKWDSMYWGHVKSKDLVNWEHLPPALAPGESYDKDGCFSGSAIEKDGKLYLMYTGNVWTGENYDEDLKQVQALAVSEDAVRFEKLAENPVISEAPKGEDIHPFHFRDPKVWKHEENYYCVLGSKTNDNIGQVLLYCSKDLLNWEFINILAKGEGNSGYMWECPDLIKLNGKDILIMSPQGVKPEGNLYQNLHQAGYVVGELDYVKGKLTYGEFELLDYGFDYYAPQTMLDNQDRRIVIAWMDMWESEMPTQEHGYSGAMTLPRVLELKNNKLITSPVKEIEQLRTNEVSYEQLKLMNEMSLTAVEGDCIELDVTFEMKQPATFGVRLRVDDFLGEETVLTYYGQKGILEFDRNESGKGPGGVRKTKIILEENKLHLRIFIDKSSIEVFINEGEQVMTGRIYPSINSNKISFFSDEEIEISSLKKWELKRSI